MNDAPTISLLHATKGRPEKALATMRLWAERAANPGTVEYVLSYNKDDAASESAFDAYLPNANMPWFEGGVVAIRGAFHGSAPAWNSAWKASSGALLVQVSDDIIPPEHWDTALLGRLPTMWEAENLVVHVSDGIRRDNLMCVAICTSAYAHWKGEFICPLYQSMYSDDDFSFRSFKHQSEGTCRVIPARDLLFKHDHHCVNPDVPEDDTYRFQNRPEAYEAGKKLFLERNPHAHGKEAKLWM